MFCSYYDNDYFYNVISTNVKSDLILIRIYLSCLMRNILLACAVALPSLCVFAQTIPAPSQTDVIIIDNNTPGKADPGDRIRYRVTIQNTGNANGNGVQFNAVPDPRTTFVPGSFRSSPLAVPDAYTCTGNVGINVPAASGVKINDFDDNLPGTTLSCGACTSANGGTVVLSNDGSFTYNPPAGFTGSDNFTYTITDGNPVGAPVPVTDNATVTITVSNVIWFVNNTGGGSGGTGTLGNPFKTLADFNAASGTAAGHTVHIQHTGTDYAGGIVLKDNMIVIGTGHTGGANLANVLSFSLAPNSPALPAINGTRPVITNAAGDGVALAQNNNLRGFNVGNCSDFGMENIGTGSVGNLVVNEVNITNGTGGGFDAGNGSGASMNVVFGSLGATGGVNGINLNGCAGTFTANGGIITNPTGAAVAITGGTVTVSVASNLSDNSGFVVDIDNHDSNNITLSGTITSSAEGIRVQNCNGGVIAFSGTAKTMNTGVNKAVSLSNNSGGTIDFTNGGLAITTGTGIGFEATGGGTVTVQGANNTISSTNNTGLNILNTNIGSSNLNFLSISANSAANGIVLTNTGTAGGLSVTGTGTTNASGGTISNITGRGVAATSTANLSLKNMVFTNANTTDGATPCSASDNSGCNAAIYLNNVTNAILDNVDIGATTQHGINIWETNGFQLLNSTLTQNGTAGSAIEEGGIFAVNLSGTVAINSTKIDFPSVRCATIYNTNKTLNMTISNSQFNDTQTSSIGADGLEISSNGNSVTDVDVTGCTFLRDKTNGIQFLTENTSAGTIDISGCTVDPGAGVGVAFDLASNGTSQLRYNVLNNTNLKGRGTSIVNCFAQGSSTMNGQVVDNTIASVGGSGSGVRAVVSGDANHRTRINNNTISGIANDFGIVAQASGGTGRLDATITNNNVTVLNSAVYNINVVAGSSGSTFTNKTCANVSGNTVSPAPISGSMIANFLARSATPSHELLLQGSSPIATYWNGNGNTPASPTATVLTSGTGVYTYNATCLLPIYP